MIEIKINSEFIKLDSFLKYSGAASMGSEAKIYILNGDVLVNGLVERQRGKKLRANDTVEFNGQIYKIV
jgi:ribosome-associated protein